jgi:hypothetical protein
MHVSLDSALGRQRRLNSVGESVLQIAPSAAAAYSLRSLTGGDPKVVRVRRASDNHEQDFTASEVSSGALTSFVNAQVVAPLDIQAETATGRDGAFLIAKAAYSLRSLGTRQATLAATGDTVARADGKYVVQVRRGSDDALKSFTATEVTDGTLLSFANPTYTVGTSVESASKPFDSFTSNGNDGFTATNNTTGSATAGFPYTFATGDVISVSFDLVIANNATPTFILSGNNMGSGSLVVGTTFTSSGSYTQEVTSGSGTGTHIAFTDGNTGTFTISNFKVTSHKADGFVKTWYDQSVDAGGGAHGNHATQATAASQPKIVNAGSLLNELDFDGTDDTLAIDFGADLSQANSLFMVHQSDTTTGSINEFFDSSGSGNPRTLLDKSGTDYRMLSTSDAGTGVAVTTDKSLIFALYNGASSLFAKNGTATGALNPGTSSINQNSTLGSSDTRFYDGTMQEFIVYNSDQTDNRTAIEANIGEAYSIDLPSGVDPGFDQVDGFVENWYDQSGNSKDAVQPTAANQPKIVNAGTLVVDSGIAGLDFDGDDFLVASSVSDLEGSLSMFSTSVRDATGYTVSPSSSSSGAKYFGIQEGGSSSVANPRNATNVLVSDSVSGVDRLTFALTTGATSTSVGALGSAVTTSTSDYGDDFDEGDLDQIAIGLLRTVSASGHFNGRIREILVYTSDQTDNRTALETNIAAEYGITLS